MSNKFPVFTNDLLEDGFSILVFENSKIFFPIKITKFFITSQKNVYLH